MKKVIVYTDGACSGNPGPGGWAALLIYGKQEREISGSEPLTTNNRMELLAAIKALGQLKEKCHVMLHTDSKYVIDGITDWVEGWEKRGWKTADKKPVKNVDLWQALIAAEAKHKVEWHWVKGHSDHEHNDRVDALAVKEAQAERAKA